MSLETFAKLAAAGVAALALAWGIAEFLRSQSVAAERPFLERKLAWCEEAVELASALAVGGVGQEAKTRFRQMFYGVMGLVENAEIREGMESF
ncbi:MAG: hypothetical protein WBA25_15440, partial [Jannaschia sp.]